MKIILEKILGFVTANKIVSMAAGAGLLVVTLVMLLTMSFCGSPEQTTTTETTTGITTEEVTTNITTQVDTTAGATSGTTTTTTTEGDVTTTWPSSITISYDSQGGEACSDSTIVPGDFVPLPWLDREGYDFLGWYTEPNGQGQLIGYNTALYQSTTLYAYWEEKTTLTVSFVTNGGNEIEDLVVYYDERSYVSLDYCYRDGYKFNGWYLNPEFTGDQYFSSISIETDVTLYASFSLPNNVFTYEYMTHEETGIEGYFLTSFNNRFLNDTLILPTEIDGNTIIGVAESFASSTSRNQVQHMYFQEGYKVIDNKAIKNFQYMRSLVLPTTLEYIGAEGLSYTGMYEVNLEDCVNLWYIGDDGFAGNSYLTSVTFPDSIEYIGKMCFYDNQNLETAIFPETLLIPVLPDAMFMECSSLTTVDLPSNLTVIPYSMFSESGLTSITIPASVHYIQDQAFRYCAYLTSITFENEANIYDIGDSAFSWTSLAENMPGGMLIINNVLVDYYGDGNNIVIPENVTKIGVTAFRHMTINSITFNSGLEEIGEGAFYETTFTTPIVLPDSLTTIDNRAFYDVNFSNQSLTMPLNLEYLGLLSFTYTNGLNDIIFPEGCALTVIQHSAFQYSSITSVTFHEGLEEIDIQAFHYTRNMYGTITLPASLRIIDDYAFNASNISNVIFEDSSLIEEVGQRVFSETPYETNMVEDFTIVNGVLVSYHGTATDVVIPETVTVIGSFAFYGTTITSVDLNNVVEIRNNAFTWTELTSIHLPASLKYIGDSGLNTGLITSITWDAGFNPEYVSCGAFGVQSTGTAYQSLDAQNLVVFGDYLYSGTLATGDIVVPANITGMSPGAFNNSGITSIVLPEGLLEIPEQAFSNTAITSIVIPSTVTSIGRYAFSGTTLTSITIPSTVEVIREYAFYATYNLTNVVFEDPSTLRIVEGDIFSYSSVLTEYLRDDEFVVVDGIVFDYIGNDICITIPDDVYYYAMAKTTENAPFIKLVIPEHVTVFQVYPYENIWYNNNITPLMVFEGTFANDSYYLEFFWDFIVDSLTLESGLEYEFSEDFMISYPVKVYVNQIVVDPEVEYILEYIEWDVDFVNPE